MKVLTPVVNNPIFIEIQYNTLKKYMQCDYEFIVFNDAKKFPDYSNGGNSNIFHEIKETCDRLGVKCITVENDHHINMSDAVIRASDSCNSILDYQRNNPDKYLVIDSDMFLVDYLNPHEHYSNFDSAFVLQSRNISQWNSSQGVAFGYYKGVPDCTDPVCNYLWNGIHYFDMTNIDNKDLLDWMPLDGTDAGGRTWKWLKTQVTKNFPTVEEIRESVNTFTDERLYYMRHLWSCTWDLSELPENLKNNEKLIEFLINDPRNINGKFFCEIYDNKFLHYRAGGNWRQEGLNFHFELSNKLLNIFL